MTATPDGTKTFAEPSGWVPVYLPSPIFKPYLADPYMSVYAQIAQSAQHHTPSIPVYSDYASAADKAVADVLNDKSLTKDALEYVSRVVQQKLDAALAKQRAQGQSGRAQLVAAGFGPSCPRFVTARGERLRYLSPT